MGVFQLESAGITNVVTGLRPQSIEDITAVVALYRPGPMQSIPRYIECRHHPEKVTYKHPLLEPILGVTYGCMIYQEQVMQVFQSLAGYSLGKADMVRRAMSKKKMKELEKERVNFIHGNEELGIDGAIKRGVPEAVAASLFDEIMDFANYAFNKGARGLLRGGFFPHRLPQVPLSARIYGGAAYERARCFREDFGVHPDRARDGNFGAAARCEPVV